MKYLKALFRPLTAATVALSTVVFVSGCETPSSGTPELYDDPQPAAPEARAAAPAPAAAAPAAEPAASEPRCNPAPVPGVRPKPGCDY